MEKSIKILILTILALSFYGCPILPKDCPRQVVNYWNLANELNHKYHCPNYMREACNDNVVFSEFEAKLGYDFLNKPYSYCTNNISSESYTIPEQDLIFNLALDIARNEAPSCSDGQKKKIYSINFFFDFTVPADNPPCYYIMTNVVYACCTGKLPN